MAKMGRPKKPISKVQFEKLCQMQCTEVEIASFFGVCEDTLNKWCKETYDGKTFSETFEEKRAGGRASLRRTQWQLANKSAAMAIFLGKQYLGQTDKVETKSEVKTTGVLNDVLQQLKDGDDGEAGSI